MIVVTADSVNDYRAHVQLYERQERRWLPKGEASPAIVGKNGIARGIGIDTDFDFNTGKEKLEGDGRSPTGIFELGTVFGIPATTEFRGKMPYKMITESLEGVDDANSRYYNQIVDKALLTTPPDWKSFESILRKDRQYYWLVEIKHNPRNQPNQGSLIFFHVRRGIKEKGTLGCVAIDERRLKPILEWLDPSGHPRIAILQKAKLTSFLAAIQSID